MISVLQGNFSLQCLETLLATFFAIDLTKWGQGKAKKPEDLWRELVDGETELRIGQSGLTRFIRVVKIRIRNPQLGTLVEDYQTFPDGRRRERNRTPTEKIKGGESPLQALHRGIQEEFGGKLKPDHYITSPAEVKTEEEPSPSYPGLRTVYELHWFGVTVNFVGAEIPESVQQADGITLFFRWVGGNPT